MMMLRHNSPTALPPDAANVSPSSRDVSPPSSSVATARNGGSPSLVIEVKSEPIDEPRPGSADRDVALPASSAAESLASRPSLAAELEAARRENQALRDRIGEQDRRLTRLADDFHRVFAEFSRLSGQLQLILDERGILDRTETALNLKLPSSTARNN